MGYLRFSEDRCPFGTGVFLSYTKADDSFSALNRRFSFSRQDVPATHYVTRTLPNLLVRMREVFPRAGAPYLKVWDELAVIFRCGGAMFPLMFLASLFSFVCHVHPPVPLCSSSSACIYYAHKTFFICLRPEVELSWCQGGSPSTCWQAFMWQKTPLYDVSRRSRTLLSAHFTHNFDHCTCRFIVPEHSYI